MKTKRTIRIALAAFVAAAIAVPAAFGAGEPKNEKPFTRPVAGSTSTEQAIRVVPGVGSPVIAGEPKNQPPFTAPFVADPGLANAMREASSPTLGLTGESKSEQPFAAQIVVPGRSFDWAAAGIGALAAAGICLIGAGGYLLSTSRRRPQEVGTPA